MSAGDDQVDPLLARDLGDAPSGTPEPNDRVRPNSGGT